MKTIHLLVKGKVQGVFYRATAKKIAESFGITGWIKNTKDGNVEATAYGDEEALNAFINWCKKGPDKAKVEEIVITGKEPQSLNEFSIIR
jgi:acylphosphatase